jgi:hypothetical protein
MSNREVKNIEDEWILKYRAALDEVPSEQPPATKLHTVLDRSYGRIAASAAKMVKRWIQTSSPRKSIRQVLSVLKHSPDALPPQNAHSQEASGVISRAS